MRTGRLQFQRGKLAVELFEGVRELLFPSGILGRRALAIELNPCEAEGFSPTYELGIDSLPPSFGQALALLLALFHLFGDTRLCVD
jgi:hypothetical protein